MGAVTVAPSAIGREDAVDSLARSTLGALEGLPGGKNIKGWQGEGVVSGSQLAWGV